MSVQKTLILAIALLLVVSAGATAASKRVNWAFSGAAIGGVALDAPAGCSMLLINVQAKGSPGSATVFGLNRDCGGPGDENSLVARFKDGSLLNVVIDPDVDVEFEFIPPNTSHLTLGVLFKGGFGRFSDANGKAALEIYFAPLEPGSSIVNEWGTFTGSIEY